MSWLSDIFSSSVGEVVGKVGEAVDRLVTSAKLRYNTVSFKKGIL